jgi:hypothetical protein
MKDGQRTNEKQGGQRQRTVFNNEHHSGQAAAGLFE